jgi:hypothetical protein
MRNFIGATLLLLPATLHAEPLTFDAALQLSLRRAVSSATDILPTLRRRLVVTSQGRSWGSAAWGVTRSCWSRDHNESLSALYSCSLVGTSVPTSKAHLNRDRYRGLRL